jgi:hypothetical protein
MSNVDPKAGPLETIELVDEEHVVPRGSAETIWFVDLGARWVAAAQTPGARVFSVDPGPGTVWERRVELQLPRGTRLLRVRSSPNFLTRTPLEHLERGAGSGRRIQRSWLRVGPGGRLDSG